MLITGCHRSGTSLLASLLSDLLGQSRLDDLPPALDNPRGYFESRRLTAFNDQLLAALGGDWCHPPLLPTRWSDPPLLDQIKAEREKFAAYATRSDWLDKDPRLCITLPAMQHLLLRRVPLLVALREPLEVAASLHLREGFSIERALCLWFLYNHHLSVSLQNRDELFIYSDLIHAVCEPSVSQAVFQRLAVFLAGHGYLVPTPDAWDGVLHQRVEPGLNRAAHLVPDLDLVRTPLNPQLVQLVQKAYSQASTGVEGHRQAFSSLPWLILDLCEQQQLCCPGHRQHQRLLQLEHAVRHCHDECGSYQRDLEALRCSVSWRTTAPLRWLMERRRFR